LEGAAVERNAGGVRYCSVTLLSLSILQKAAAVGGAAWAAVRGLARAAHLRQRGRAARQGLSVRLRQGLGHVAG